MHGATKLVLIVTSVLLALSLLVAVALIRLYFVARQRYERDVRQREIEILQSYEELDFLKNRPQPEEPIP